MAVKKPLTAFLAAPFPFNDLKMIDLYRGLIDFQGGSNVRHSQADP
jgi:hypothetical protein